ncbi:hypothetical protein AB0I98_48810 [Streptomyces sp. NPDC050211]
MQSEGSALCRVVDDLAAHTYEMSDLLLEFAQAHRRTPDAADIRPGAYS